MADTDPSKNQSSGAAKASERPSKSALGEALRANLRRRKQQARERREVDGPAASKAGEKD